MQNKERSKICMTTIPESLRQKHTAVQKKKEAETYQKDIALVLPSAAKGGREKVVYMVFFEQMFHLPRQGPKKKKNYKTHQRVSNKNVVSRFQQQTTVA